LIPSYTSTERDSGSVKRVHNKPSGKAENTTANGRQRLEFVTLSGWLIDTISAMRNKESPPLDDTGGTTLVSLSVLQAMRFYVSGISRFWLINWL
jgi:hypothetical protein